jgi:predicted RNA-binding protein associated with RNAse of E/G family
LNGLDLPIEEGDYAITVVTEGQWHFQHTYYRRDGRPIGEYYNINTPVEFYPWGIRYVDLEVDVIRRAGKPPVLIDRDRLSILVREGFVHRGLEEKALRTSHELMQALSSP